MPRERREIEFSHEELEAAVRSYARTNPRFLPVAQDVACRYDAAGRLTIVVNAAYGATVQTMTIEARDEDTLALLVRFCIENNIMLPRAGKKSVVAGKEGLVLVVELDQPTQPG